MQWYKPPPPEAIADLSLEMHWYSYYQKWTPQENFYYAVTHTGLELNDEGRTESTYTKYASLDDRADGYHFYLAYMKFGLGRCSRDAQSDIRRNHITRDEGVAWFDATTMSSRSVISVGSWTTSESRRSSSGR